MEEGDSSSAASPGFIKEFPDPILDNVLEYVLKSCACYHEVEGIAANPDLQRWGFSEDIARAVMVAMLLNRTRRIYIEILDLTGISLFIDFSESTMQEFDNKIHNYGYMLILGDQSDCLKYLAVICEIILNLCTGSGKCLIRRVIDIAKVTLRRYASTNYFYMDLDASSKFVIGKRSQLCPRQYENDDLSQNEYDDVFIENKSDCGFIQNESGDVIIQNKSDDLIHPKQI